MSHLIILCGLHINFVMHAHNMLLKSWKKPQFSTNFENTENAYKNGHKSLIKALNGKTYWGFDLF